MAKQSSAQKRHKQSLKKRLRNRHVRATVKSVTKDVRTAIDDGKTDKVGELLSQAASVIARAGSKGVYHKKNISRKISRLSRAAHKAATAGKES